MSIYGDRELDVHVALALGWKWRALDTSSGQFRGLYPPGPTYIYPICGATHGELGLRWSVHLHHFRTDPAAIFGLLEEMSKRGFDFTLSGGEPPFLASLWRRQVKLNLYDSSAPTLGEAVCRAVLAALGEPGAGKEMP